MYDLQLYVTSIGPVYARCFTVFEVGGWRLKYDGQNWQDLIWREIVPHSNLLPQNWWFLVLSFSKAPFSSWNMWKILTVFLRCKVGEIHGKAAKTAIDTIDRRNPAPPGMQKKHVDNGTWDKLPTSTGEFTGFLVAINRIFVWENCVGTSNLVEQKGVGKNQLFESWELIYRSTMAEDFVTLKLHPRKLTWIPEMMGLGKGGLL